MRDPLRPLALLLGGFAGRPLRVESLGDESLSRPVLRATHLLLPRAFPHGRAAVAHVCAHLRYSPAGLRTTGLKPMSIAVISAIEDARVERLLLRDYPGLREWFLPLLRGAVRRDVLGFEAFMSRLDLALIDPLYEDESHWVAKARALFEAQAAVDLHDYAAFRHTGSILANDLGQMRVRFQAQQYVVPAPYRDDNAYLWECAESAAQALEIGVGGMPGAAAGDCEPRIVETEVRRFSYPEWHYKIGLDRPDWCTVIESRSVAGSASPGSMPAPLGLVSPARLRRGARLRRQWEGEDIDLDAAIEGLVERRLGRVAEPRFFQQPGRYRPSLHVLVLLDLSQSANDLAAGGRTVLELEKDAALLFAGSAAAAGDRVAVHGFCSNTRAAVDYRRMVDFDTCPAEAGAAAIRAAPARHSTRMGAAIRHAANLLAPAGDRRILLLFSDGMPSDIDVHDSRHLLEDARKAVAEVRSAGTEVACIGLDMKMQPQLCAVFGREGFQLWDGRGGLEALLQRIYRRCALRAA